MVIENQQKDKKDLNVNNKKFLEKYIFAENREKKAILKENQKQHEENLKKSTDQLGNTYKITKQNQTNIFLKDNGDVTVHEVLADQSGVFRYKLGDSIGVGALDMLKDGQTGFMPKMTHKRDLSPGSTQDLVIQISSSQGSLRNAETSKEPILTID